MGILFVIGIFPLFRLTNPDEIRLFGSLSFARPFLVWFSIPIVAGLIGGGSLAEDRRRGYPSIVLTHGLSRRDYFWSKLIGTSLASACIVILGLLGFLLIAAFVLPWENSLIPENSLGPLMSAPGPMPTLFQVAPALNDLLSMLMLAAASAALSTVGTLLGTLITSEYLTIALLLVLVIGAFYVLYDEKPNLINPLLYLDVWWSYKSYVPAQFQAYAAFVYWGIVGGVSALFAWIIFSRKEG